MKATFDITVQLLAAHPGKNVTAFYGQHPKREGVLCKGKVGRPGVQPGTVVSLVVDIEGRTVTALPESDIIEWDLASEKDIAYFNKNYGVGRGIAIGAVEFADRGIASDPALDKELPPIEPLPEAVAETESADSEESDLDIDLPPVEDAVDTVDEEVDEEIESEESDPGDRLLMMSEGEELMDDVVGYDDMVDDSTDPTADEMAV